MNVTIRERKFSLRSEYDIEAPDCSYCARKKLFSLLPRLELFTERHHLLARIMGRWSLFRTRYDFVFTEGNAYRFWREKVWKGVFACENNEEKFKMYTHKGLNYSIFHNDLQIAAFRKNRIVIGKGNEYDVRVDRDANLPVVICMVLVLNTEEDDDEHETVTVDFGNIGPEEIPFDESWQPN